MPKKRRRIFISHPWSSEDFHGKISNLLQNGRKKTYYDHSVQRDKPLLGDRREVKKQIEQRIKGSSTVIVTATNHASHRKMIREEIRIAKRCDKPIVAVRPRGQERVSKIVRENADAIVGWNRKSISRALRKASNGRMRKKRGKRGR